MITQKAKKLYNDYQKVFNSNFKLLILVILTPIFLCIECHSKWNKIIYLRMLNLGYICLPGTQQCQSSILISAWYKYQKFIQKLQQNLILILQFLHKIIKSIFVLPINTFNHVSIMIIIINTFLKLLVELLKHPFLANLGKA